MTGFWTPAFRWLERLFILWGVTLRNTVPEKMRSHLQWSQPKANLLANIFLNPKNMTGLGDKSITVQIEPDQCLRYRFTIPFCAGADLRRAVELEAERVLPVHISKLLTASRVVSVDKEQQTIVMDIVAARKSLIENIVETAHAHDLSLQAVEALSADGGAPIEFTIYQIKHRRRTVAAFGIASVATLFLLGVQAPSLYLNRLKEAVEITDQKIVNARAATKKVASLQSEMREKKSLTTAIANIKKDQRQTELFATLTDASPDSVVLETLRVDLRRLYISGTATDAESWAITLGKMVAFEDVVIVSVREQPGRKQQRFEIRLNVNWPGLREGLS